MPVVYFLLMEYSLTSVSRSKWIAEKDSSNGEYGFFFRITLN